MSFKMTMIGAALSLSLAPLAAHADGYFQQPRHGQRYQQSYGAQYQQRPGIAVGEPRPDRQYDHGWRDGGRYLQRNFRHFAPGQYRQVWVPEQCNYRERGFYRGAAPVCVPAHYERVWVPYGVYHRG